MVDFKIYFFLANFSQGFRPKLHDFLLLNINILILHYASIQSKIDDSRVTDSLRQCIVELETKNNKIKTENDELKARVVILEDKQTQNELIKNLMSVSCDKTVK